MIATSRTKITREKVIMKAMSAMVIVVMMVVVGKVLTVGS
jgi:hypothetical protein